MQESVKSPNIPIKVKVIVLLIAVSIPFIRTIPAIGYYMKPTGQYPTFAGIGEFHNYDTHQYLAFARQARDKGTIFMENLYTSEPQGGRYIILSTYIIGKVSAWLKISLPVSNIVVSVIAGTLFLLSVWYFSGILFVRVRERLCFYVLVSVYGGMDWIVELLSRSISLDNLKYIDNIVSAERGYSVFYWIQNGIWCMGASLVLVAITLIIKRSGPNRLVPHKYILLCGLLLSLAFFMHPYSAIGDMGILLFLGLWSIIDRRCETRLGLSCFAVISIALVLIVAYLLWARQDFVFREMTGQGWVPGKNVMFLWYPLTYGAVFFLAMYGLKCLKDLPNNSRALLLSWAGGLSIICSTPLVSGYKYQHFLGISLAAIASIGYLRLSDALKQRLGFPLRLIIILVIWTALLAGSVYITVRPLMRELTDYRRNKYYLEKSEESALKALEAAPDGLVLSSTSMGKLIPWMTGKKVYSGHWFCTLNIREKDKGIMYFFRSQDIEAKKAFLKNKGIRYVYWGKRERLHKFRLDPLLDLKPLYEDNETIVLKVY